MKFFTRLALLMGLLTGSLSLSAQVTISGVTTSPVPALECSNTFVAVTGQHFCANYVFSNATTVLSGTTLQVDIYYTVGFICLPAIVPYSQTVNMGMIPAGTYNLIVNTYLNGSLSNTNTSPLVIGSCCSVDAGLAASQIKVCEGDSIQFSANDPSLSSLIWKLDGSPVSTNSQFSYTFNQAGTYTLTLLGDNGLCADSSSQLITVSSPQSSTQLMDESCPGSLNGSVTLSISGGVAPYTYTWSNGASTQNLTQLTSGTYLVAYMDSLGCIGTDTAVIQTGPPVVANFSYNLDSLLCPNSTMLFNQTGSGASQYEWFQNGSSFATSPTSTFPFVNAGNYLIELVASNGVCSDTSSQLIVVSTSPILSGLVTDEGCPNSANGGIDLSVSAGIGSYTYSWSNGSTMQDLSAVTGGTYTVTVSDSLGCTSSESYTVNTAAGPSAGFSYSTPALICEGTEVAFTNSSTGATQSRWSSNGAVFAQTSNASLNFGMNGTYDIQLFVSDGFCTDSIVQTLTVAAPPTTSGVITQPTCPPADMDGAIDLSVSGGSGNLLFSWPGGIQTEDRSNLGTGRYIVTVTDGAGCVVKDTFDLAFRGGLEADFSFFVGGNGAQFTDLSDSTAVGWQWAFGDGTTSSQQNPLHFYPIFGGYQACLIATDQYGCADTVCQNLDIKTALDPEQILLARVYPNPSTGLTFVELPGIQGPEMDLRLYDATGRLVYQQRGSSQLRFELDMSPFSAGVYQLLVKTKGQVFGTKILRQ